MVIGGLTVAEMAKKYNLNVIEGDADNNSIEQAINEAHGLLKYINRENLKLVMSHAALNQSREGIMCVDQLGEIININAIGMTLFQCQVGDKIFKKEAFKDIYASMINESNIKEQTIEINGTLVCISVRHFSNRQNTYAIITGLSQESTLWQQTNSKKSKLRGYATSYSFDNIIAQSPIMHQVIQKARLCAQHDLPVHLLGDTGTGRNCLLRVFITSAPAAMVLLSPSTARLFRRACWKVNFSVMPKAHLPMRGREANPGSLKWPLTERYLSMRSVRPRCRSR